VEPFIIDDHPIADYASTGCTRLKNLQSRGKIFHLFREPEQVLVEQYLHTLEDSKAEKTSLFQEDPLTEYPLMSFLKEEGADEFHKGWPVYANLSRPQYLKIHTESWFSVDHIFHLDLEHLFLEPEKALSEIGSFIGTETHRDPEEDENLHFAAKKYQRFKDKLLEGKVIGDQERKFIRSQMGAIDRPSPIICK